MFDDNVPYFKIKYKYCENGQEKYISGKSSIQYDVGENVAIYIEEENIVQKECAKSSVTIIIFFILGLIFSFATYLFLLLQKGVAFGSSNIAQNIVLIISCFGFL